MEWKRIESGKDSEATAAQHQHHNLNSPVHRQHEENN